MKNITSGVGLIEKLENSGPIIGLEIGVYKGENASNLLENLPNLILYGIDPYRVYKDWNGSTLTVENASIAENTAIESILPYKERFVKCKNTSDELFSTFEDNYFDFIFIDGCHDYEQVLKDCRNYYSKLKSGGIFSGHDYLSYIGGVKQAVDEFAAETGKTVEGMDLNAWFFVK